MFLHALHFAYPVLSEGLWPTGCVEIPTASSSRSGCLPIKTGMPCKKIKQSGKSTLSPYSSLSQPLPGKHIPGDPCAVWARCWLCAGKGRTLLLRGELAVPELLLLCATHSQERDTSQQLPHLLFLDPPSGHAMSLIFRLRSPLESYQIFSGLLPVGVTHTDCLMYSLYQTDWLIKSFSFKVCCSIHFLCRQPDFNSTKQQFQHCLMWVSEVQ